MTKPKKAHGGNGSAAPDDQQSGTLTDRTEYVALLYRRAEILAALELGCEEISTWARLGGGTAHLEEITPDDVDRLDAVLDALDNMARTAGGVRAIRRAIEHAQAPIQPPITS
jgi:hypothetical protein